MLISTQLRTLGDLQEVFGTFFLCNTLLPATLPENSRCQSLPGHPWPTQTPTLLTVPWKLSPGSKLGQSQGSPHFIFPISGITVLCCLTCRDWEQFFFYILPVFKVVSDARKVYSPSSQSILVRSQSPIRSFRTISSFLEPWALLCPACLFWAPQHHQLWLVGSPHETLRPVSRSSLIHLVSFNLAELKHSRCSTYAWQNT